MAWARWEKLIESPAAIPDHHNEMIGLSLIAEPAYNFVDHRRARARHFLDVSCLLSGNLPVSRLGARLRLAHLGSLGPDSFQF
jgi:hypothetical protein